MTLRSFSSSVIFVLVAGATATTPVPILNRMYSCDTNATDAAPFDNIWSAVPLVVNYSSPGCSGTPGHYYNGPNASWTCFVSPESVRDALAALPAGSRALTFEGGSTMYYLERPPTEPGGVRARYFMDTDPATGVVGPWMDVWQASLTRWFTDWFAAFKRAGGDVDFLQLDFEMGGSRYWYAFANQKPPSGAKPWEVLAADPRWPALRDQLNARGKHYGASFNNLTDMNHWTSADPRAQVWDLVLVIDGIAAALNASVFKPARAAGFPDLKASNFAHRHTTDIQGANGIPAPESPDGWWPQVAVSGVSPLGGGAHVGTAQSAGFYGGTNDSSIFFTTTGMGQTREVRADAFTSVVTSAARARDAYRAAPAGVGFHPWLCPWNSEYSGHGWPWLSSPLPGDNATVVRGMWAENLFHIGLNVGTTDWFWWRPGDQVPHASGLARASTVLRELDAAVAAAAPACVSGGAFAQDLVLSPVTANTSIANLEVVYLLSGMEVRCGAGTGTVFRFTPRCLTFPPAKETQCSTWQDYKNGRGFSIRIGSGVELTPVPGGKLWFPSAPPSSAGGWWIVA